jgi:hypothetical protein
LSCGDRDYGLKEQAFGSINLCMKADLETVEYCSLMLRTLSFVRPKEDGEADWQNECLYSNKIVSICAGFIAEKTILKYNGA